MISIGDTRKYKIVVTKADFAAFNGKIVHEVYSTYALTRDAEWTGRLFVLELKAEDEEGIGSFVNITHHSPAFIDDEVCITAELTKLDGKSVECNIIAAVKNRIIATGKTGQKILKKEKIKNLFDSYK
ncbi:MAG: hotdog domain-containing protein [Bacteroidota bacterium]|nr:hotdog domain-containing protein [Bacteroidota bacterium]